uniref:Uncharacterized protein n=1 Tax=Pristionchus pacificus TaxID=54126 RepID=A0A2A6BTV4_PRIPA|eukprot:PDM69359.1 hypothetical protein PRIPAC_47661 [Pristionchus pacificus]
MSGKVLASSELPRRSSFSPHSSVIHDEQLALLDLAATSRNRSNNQEWWKEADSTPNMCAQRISGL